jgi:ubiquinone/menaquinone biosynthesis C-methylase UbiE
MRFIKIIINKLLPLFIPKYGILYWKFRAKQFGVRSVLDMRHSEKEIENVTSMQIQEIFPYLKAQLDGTEKIILDFGCGPGRFTVKLAEMIQGKVIGVDPIKSLLDIAPVETNVSYKIIKNNHIPLEDHSVDVVWVCLVLGGLHGKVLQESINEICRVLRPKGLLFLVEKTTEIRNSDKNKATWSPRSIDEYKIMFPSINLKHLHDYYDLDARISIIAGRSI